MSSAAIRRHWTRIAALGCVICGMPAEVAHAHGGSVVGRTHEPHAKGRKIPRLDWLALPACPYHHRLGPPGEALDLDVDLWELRHGTQAGHIDNLCERFGIDLWELARSKTLFLEVA